MTWEDKDGITRDETGRPVGFLVGKALALVEWQAKKERQSFDALCNSLRVCKWQREVREKNGAMAERLRARQRDYQRRVDVMTRSEMMARERRRSRYAKNPRVRVCRQCGKREELPFRSGGPVGDFCADKCRQKFRYHERKRIQ